jgi:hypothetical protein
MLLAVGALALGAVAVNCNGNKKEPTQDLGTARLAIMTSPGVNIATVNYTISGNGITPRTGTIAVSNPGATVSVLVSGIPAGMGYIVELTATSTDGNTMCSGTSMPFAVVAGQTTLVSVRLDCRAGNNNGSVSVNGVFNNCPAINSYTAAPLATAAGGGTIAVGSSASDLDMADTLAYAWTATGGSFAPPGAANSVYTCGPPGPQTLTISVSDSKCTTTATIAVTCVALECGNGMVGAGEECEPPGTATCDANCQRVPVCGDTFTDAPETCDPSNINPNPTIPVGPNVNTCSATCQTIPIECGNGMIQMGETCDPPGAIPGSSDICLPTCQRMMQVPASCGDNIVQPGPPRNETCEPPNTPICDSMCHETCSPCRLMNCDQTFAGCHLYTGMNRTLCDAALNCMKTSHCVDVSGDATPCYCGTASVTACLTGGANGVCRAAFEAACLVAPGDPMLECPFRLVDPAFPVGGAVNQVGCDAAFCPMQCPR